MSLGITLVTTIAPDKSTTSLTFSSMAVGATYVSIFFLSDGMSATDKSEAPRPIHAETHTVVPISHVIFEPAPLERTKIDSIKIVAKTTAGKK